jgi:hypothetical protein
LAAKKLVELFCETRNRMDFYGENSRLETVLVSCFESNNGFAQTSSNIFESFFFQKQIQLSRKKGKFNCACFHQTVGNKKTQV